MYDSGGERERVHNLLIIKPIRDEAFRRWPNEHHTITIITTYSCVSSPSHLPHDIHRNCSGIPAFVCDVASSTPSMTDSAKAKTSPSLALTFASRLIYEPMIVVVRPCRRCYPLSIARSL